MRRRRPSVTKWTFDQFRRAVSYRKDYPFCDEHKCHTCIDIDKWMKNVGTEDPLAFADQLTKGVKA